MNINKSLIISMQITIVLLLSILIMNCKNESRVIMQNDQIGTVHLFNTGKVPVLTDGIFSNGEWEDAVSVHVHESVDLLFKRIEDYIFIGIKCRDFVGPSIDLYVTDGSGLIHQLHISAQLGERVISPRSEKNGEPKFKWGYTKDWYANEVRWDEYKLQHIMKMENKTRIEAFSESAYKFEGVEMQIRQSKFQVSEWLLRLEIWYPPVFKTPFIFPEASSTEDTDNWIRLKLMD